jgi:hypothetical protein
MHPALLVSVGFLWGLTILFNFDKCYSRVVRKEGLFMKKFKKAFLSLVAVTLVMGCLSSTGWAEDKWAKEDPVGQGWTIMDVVFARPLGVAAGIAGTAIFFVSLPFTIPSGGVREAADLFVVKPFQFSFTRQFPDDDI